MNGGEERRRGKGLRRGGRLLRLRQEAGPEGRQGETIIDGTRLSSRE